MDFSHIHSRTQSRQSCQYLLFVHALSKSTAIQLQIMAPIFANHSFYLEAILNGRWKSVFQKANANMSDARIEQVSRVSRQRWNCLCQDRHFTSIWSIFHVFHWTKTLGRLTKKLFINPNKFVFVFSVCATQPCMNLQFRFIEVKVCLLLDTNQPHPAGDYKSLDIHFKQTD